MSNIKLSVFPLGKAYAVASESATLTLDLLSVRIGADNLPITQSGSGGGAAFSFGTRALADVIDPTNPQDVATKAYVDATVSTGSTGAISVVSAGVLAKEVVFFNATFQAEPAGSLAAGAYATAAAAGPAPKVGLVLTGAAALANAQVIVQPGKVLGGFTGLTSGEVYIGSTPGALVQSLAGFATGDAVFKVGHAISATQVCFEPQFLYFY
jgi:hypothetical protein